MNFLDKYSYGRRIISALMAGVFALSSIGVAQAQVSAAVVPLSKAFAPVLIKGISVHPDNAMMLDFIVDPGEGKSGQDTITPEATRLIKYFMAALAVPENDLWVNLSPYEKDRIVPEALGETDMGRDMLAQDYLLKQVTASLMDPKGDIGARFWARVYSKAREEYGTIDIPVDTFNKVWIMPDKAVVYQKNGKAVVVESRLKVMLESDYVAMSRQKDIAESPAPAGDLAKQILRSVIIPVLEKEVNEGETFAPLRQIYHSLILAHWFRNNLKTSILNKVYADKNKVRGINIDDKAAAQKIWAEYVESFQKGVYDFIREERDPFTQELVPRKYFSGGVVCDAASLNKAVIVTDAIQTGRDFAQDASKDVLRVTTSFAPSEKNETAQGYRTFDDLKKMVTALRRDIPGLFSQDSDRRAAGRIIDIIGGIYEDMGLSTARYHNMAHNLGVVFIALLSAIGSADEKDFTPRDIKILFLAAIFHDFHIRSTEKGSPAVVHETLRQFRDIAGLSPQDDLSDEPLYAEKIAGKKDALRQGMAGFLGEEDLKDAYLEIEAIIRRTDYGPDMPALKARHDDFVNTAVKHWRSVRVSRLAEIVTLADRSAFYVLLDPALIARDIIQGLREEGVTASVEGTYPFFFKSEFLIEFGGLWPFQRLPLEYRKNFVRVLEYFAARGVLTSAKDWEERKPEILSVLDITDAAEGMKAAEDTVYRKEEFISRSFAVLDRLYNGALTSCIARSIVAKARKGTGKERMGPVKILFVGVGRGNEAVEAQKMFGDLVDVYAINREEGLFYDEQAFHGRVRDLSPPEYERFMVAWKKVSRNVKLGDLDVAMPDFDTSFDLVIMGNMVVPYFQDKIGVLNSLLEKYCRTGGSLFSFISHYSLLGKPMAQHVSDLMDRARRQETVDYFKHLAVHNKNLTAWLDVDTPVNLGWIRIRKTGRRDLIPLKLSTAAEVSHIKFPMYRSYYIKQEDAGAHVMDDGGFFGSRELIDLAEKMGLRAGQGVEAGGTGGGIADIVSYDSDVREGVQAGNIIMAAEQKHDPYSPATLVPENTRHITPNGDLLFRFLLKAKRQGPLTVLGVGGGLGVELADMSRRGEYFGQEVELDMVGLTPVAPRFRPRLDMGEIRDIVRSAGVYAHDLDLGWVLGHQRELGQEKFFELLRTPYLHRQFIGDVAFLKFPAGTRYQFIYDNYGALHHLSYVGKAGVLENLLQQLDPEQGVLMWNTFDTSYDIREYLDAGSGYVPVYYGNRGQGLLIVPEKSIYARRMRDDPRVTKTGDGRIFFVTDIQTLLKIWGGTQVLDKSTRSGESASSVGDAYDAAEHMKPADQTPYLEEGSLSRSYASLDRLYGGQLTSLISQAVFARAHTRGLFEKIEPVKILVVGAGRGNEAIDLKKKFGRFVDVYALNKEKGLFYDEEAFREKTYNLFPIEYWKAMSAWRKVSRNLKVGDLSDETLEFGTKFDLVVLGHMVMPYFQDKVDVWNRLLEKYCHKDGYLLSLVSGLTFLDQRSRGAAPNRQDLLQKELMGYLGRLSEMNGNVTVHSSPDKPRQSVGWLRIRKTERYQIPLKLSQAVSVPQSRFPFYYSYYSRDLHPGSAALNDGGFFEDREQVEPVEQAQDLAGQTVLSPETRAELFGQGVTEVELRGKKFILALRQAMDVAVRNEGGIDLKAGNMNLETRGDHAEFRLPEDWRGVDLNNIEGLTPAIISITPIRDMPAFLGLN